RGIETADLDRRILLSNAADMLNESSGSAEVKAMLATATTLGPPAAPRTPSKALMLGHMLLQEINGVKQTFGYARGGMGGISQALAKAASHRGATILTSAEVRRIVTRNGRAVGVELADGRSMDARRVLANVDVKTTFERLVDPDSVDPDFL